MQREIKRHTNFGALLSGESALYNRNSPESESLKQEDMISALFYNKATPYCSYCITMPLSKVLDTHTHQQGVKLRPKSGKFIHWSKCNNYAILTQSHYTNSDPWVGFSVSGRRLVCPQGEQEERNPCVDIYHFTSKCEPALSGSLNKLSTGTVSAQLARTKITIELMGLENFDLSDSDLTIVGNDLLVLTVCGSLRLFQGARVNTGFFRGTRSMCITWKTLPRTVNFLVQTVVASPDPPVPRGPATEIVKTACTHTFISPQYSFSFSFFSYSPRLD